MFKIYKVNNFEEINNFDFEPQYLENRSPSDLGLWSVIDKTFRRKRDFFHNFSPFSFSGFALNESLGKIRRLPLDFRCLSAIFA